MIPHDHESIGEVDFRHQTSFRISFHEVGDGGWSVGGEDDRGRGE